MKISSIVIENFRGFKGKHRIDFSTDEDKPITLIFAKNGVGKTNILNAILWCLHNKFTSSFKDQDELINDDNAGTNEKGEYTENAICSVELTIEARDATYMITRSFHSKDTEKQKFSVMLKKEHNTKAIPGNPEIFINQLIPYDMAKYFFFDGESVQKLMDIKDQIVEEFILNCFSHCIRNNYTAKKAFDAKLDNFWINENLPNSYNQEHVHPYTDFSGVYYLEVPKNY